MACAAIRWTRDVSIAAFVRVVFAALIPLFPDEAYYWEWSRRLAPGYFDHPAGIALLIRFGGVLLAPFGASASPLGVRLGAVVAGWIACVATVATASRLGGNTAALRAAANVRNVTTHARSADISQVWTQ